jgi:hypothetical protein
MGGARTFFGRSKTSGKPWGSFSLSFSCSSSPARKATENKKGAFSPNAAFDCGDTWFGTLGASLRPHGACSDSFGTWIGSRGVQFDSFGARIESHSAKFDRCGARIGSLSVWLDAPGALTGSRGAWFYARGALIECRGTCFDSIGIPMGPRGACFDARSGRIGSPARGVPPNGAGRV